MLIVRQLQSIISEKREGINQEFFTLILTLSNQREGNYRNNFNTLSPPGGKKWSEGDYFKLYL